MHTLLLHQTTRRRSFYSHSEPGSYSSILNAHLIIFLTGLQNYKIVHLEGSPQGPSFSFVSDSALAPFVFAFGVDVFVSFAVSLFSVPVCPAFSPASPFVEPSSQKLTLLTAFPNDSPWMVASSSSRAVGWREPSAALKVPAPHGEPPRISLRFARTGKEVL